MRSRESSVLAVVCLAALAACINSATPAARPDEAPAADKDLREPFWASDSPSRPNRAHPLDAVLRAAEESKVVRLTADQETMVRRSASSPSPRPIASSSLSRALTTPTRIVTGLDSFTFHQETSTTLQPNDLTGFPIQALVPNAAGAFDTLAGTGHSDGTFSILDVPVGNYWMKVGSNYLWTSNDHVEWVFDLYGRADAVGPDTDPTNLVMNATNLAAWQTTDELFWTVPGHGFSTSLAGFASAGDPVAGDAALSNYTINFANGFFPLLEAAKGDQAYITQLTTRSIGTEKYRALGKIWNLPATTMVDGATTTASGGFLDIAQTSSLRLNWRRSALAAMTAQVNPSASVVGTEIGLWTTPLGLNEGIPGTAFQLVTYDSGPTTATTDLDLGDATYGNPFPASWPLLAETYFVFSMSYLAPGATTAVRTPRSAYTATSTLPTATSPIVPLLGPALNPRINGKDLFSNQVAVGSTPTLTWDAPSLGAATGYVVRVLELRAVAGASRLLSRATFRTPLRTFTVPPGILVPGSTYVFSITAQRNPGVSAGEYPFRTTFPFSTAPLMTAIVAP